MIDEARRYLIAVGSPEAPGQRFLHHVAPDVSRISDLLCNPSQGYQRILSEKITLGAKAKFIQDSILDWFTDNDRRVSDLLVLYFAGHGGDAGRSGNYYLFTSDTDENQLSRTAINIGRFVQDLYEGDGERPQSVLIILDACFSGKGGAQAVAQGALIRQQGGFRDGAGLWIVATADSLSEAEDGAFVEAIFAVLKDPAWAPAGGAEYLNPIDVFVWAVNEWFHRHNHAQQVEWDVLGNRRRPVFLRNPRYTNKFEGAPLLDESHWDVKARGVDDVFTTGWFFTGRREVLRALVSWLNAPISDSKARVVTGRPGSGKSAVLARLVTSAHPTKRAQMLAHGILDLSDGTVPAENGIKAYVHARHLSLIAVARSIAEQLSLPAKGVDDLLALLAGCLSATAIVVDALDEAQDPSEIEFLLLRKLIQYPAVRLIVGTRKHGDYVPLSEVSEVVDLDQEQYFERPDIVQYVFARLTAETARTPYSSSGQHENAHKISELIADRAGFSFLFARILSRSLGAASAPIETHADGWAALISIPTDLYQAFDLDLGRFPGVQREFFTDLLIPLAWARGKGLPQKGIWAGLASSISGRDYSNGNIEELKRAAGYYIVQDSENGQVVYRLFHESFAEYLRLQSHQKKPDSHFLAVLETMARVSVEGNPIWSRVIDEYTLHNLPAHAAAAGELDRLVCDAEFLLNFSPESLLPHLKSVKSLDGRTVIRAYRAVIHHLRKQDKTVKISYLLLSAIQYGAKRIVDQLIALSREETFSWKVIWGTWIPRTVSEVAAELDKPLLAYEYVNDGDRPTFIVGADEYVLVYDAITSRELIRSKPLGLSVERLACVRKGQNRWIIAGGRERSSESPVASLVSLRYPSCEFYKKRENAHSGWAPLRSFGSAEFGSDVVVASGGCDLALRLWSVPNLDLLSESPKADFSAIPGFVFVPSADHPMLVCGSDAVNPDGERSSEGVSVFAVSIPDLTRIWTVYGERGGYVKHLVIVTVNSIQLALAEFEHEGLRLIEIATGRVLATGSADLDVFGSLKTEASSVFAIGDRYGRLQMAEIRASLEGGHQRVEIMPPSRAIEVGGTQLQGPLRIGSRDAIAGIAANQLRLWEMEDLISDTKSDYPSWRQDLSAAIWILNGNQADVVTVDLSGSINIKEGTSGKDLSTIQIKLQDFDNVKCAASGFIRSSPILALGTRRGQILIYDPISGQLLRTLQAGSQVEAIAAWTIGKTSLLSACTNLNEEGKEGLHVVMTWDLITGAEKHLRPDSSWHERSNGRLLLDGYSDKSLRCLAIGGDHGKPILYAAGPYSFVGAWRVDGGKAVKIADYWITPHRGNEWIEALAVGDLDGKAVIAAGNEEGILVLWDAAARKEIAQIPSAHRGALRAVAFLTDNRGIVTSGTDGMLRVWSKSGELKGEIDLEFSAINLLPLGRSGNRVMVATRLGVFVLELNF